jgi:hypothetical protein
MPDDEDLISEEWRLDQEIMRRNAVPAVPAAMSVDDLIRFLDQALRLAEGPPTPRAPAADYSRYLI